VKSPADSAERSLIKHPDNLHPEEEFAKQIPKKIEPAERRSLIKHPDNLESEDDDSKQDRRIGTTQGF